MPFPVQIYNTLAGQKENFSPRTPGKVSMYACGLTPQDAPHIGHIRGAIVMDVIRRWFEANDIEVDFVQNFTDIDDKIINKMKTENATAEQIADKYTAEYESELNLLGIKPITFVKVTSNMPEIIEMISTLISKGFAYEMEGDVYFSVAKFPEYGKLSGRKQEDMKAGARVEVDDRKQNSSDFALWKSAKPGEPSWDSPWGRGRPGWHIECSALSLKYLGPGFDIHAGGTDLIFPHHENEIAQSEAYLDHQQFCKVWIHWGAITSGGEKMSKSVGNDAKIRRILEKYSADSVRLYLLGTSYRSPIDFSHDRLEEAQVSLGRLQRAMESAKKLITDNHKVDASHSPFWERFTTAMNNDFNTSQAISSLFDAVTELNRLSSNQSIEDESSFRMTYAVLEKMTSTLGFQMLNQNAQSNVQSLEPLMQKVLQWRKQARDRKDFSLSDQIRDDLKEIGIIIEDGPSGTSWRQN